ncbi:biotin transporter BioY [Paenibacillus lutrae]|uniref:Biotin transporter n=1 Tax=Paenibacillus lutrae TaxID=2078573 RepID=A0A7X3FIV4_9BACL|nr:biotin transporter BioY [Paenibacillus lutrae]MVP00137.1 biotin transporter BioY [Paenibacillus lutrae]
MQLKRSPLTVRGITFSAMFAALLVALSFVNIHVGFSPVPITMSNFAIMLAGALLGARYGFFSIALVVGLTAVGLPLLHGRGGLDLILGPTGGFIWAYPLAALFIGWMIPRIKGKGAPAFILTFGVLMLFGSLLLYVTGVPWMMHVVPNMTFAKAMAVGCYPFLIGDALKAVVATLIIVPVRHMYPASRLVGGHTKAWAAR